MLGENLDFEVVGELILQAVNKGLKKAVTSITERQDAIEKKTENQLETFKSLLVPLRQAIQEKFSQEIVIKENSPTPQHCQEPSTTARFSSSDGLLLSCNICGPSLESFLVLDGHIKANHPILQCTICNETLKSKPDLNLHHHRYHPEIVLPQQVPQCSLPPHPVPYDVP